MHFWRKYVDFEMLPWLVVAEYLETAKRNYLENYENPVKVKKQYMM